MTKKWVMANWKMYGSKEMIEQYVDELGHHAKKTSVELVIFPPVVYLDFFKQYLSKGSFTLGAQNVASELEGAYTGEISVPMLKELSCKYVLIGHSERRNIFNESPEILSKKFHIVKEHGMIPVFCIGETLENYQQKKTKEVLRFQLESLLKTADFLFEKCIIAYEPVWAIGTGLTPTHDEIKHVFSDIKEIIKDMSPKTTDIHMLYGGSVNEKNISMINSIETCSGVLVGGASLKVKQLLEIIKCITYC
jgi:triosephosphate isomerase